MHVDLPKPRDRIAVSESIEYNNCRHEVLRFLYERHGKKVEELSTNDETIDEDQKNDVVDFNESKRSKENVA